MGAPLDEQGRDRALLNELAEPAATLFERHLGATKQWYPFEDIPWGHATDLTRRVGRGRVPPLCGRTQRAVRQPAHRGQPPLLHERAPQVGAKGPPAARMVRALDRRGVAALRGDAGLDPRDQSAQPLGSSRTPDAPDDDRDRPGGADGSRDAGVRLVPRLATQVAHRNTGQSLDRTLRGKRIMSQIAGDEGLHHAFYRDLAAAAIERDPSFMVVAIYRQLRSFQMPGTGIPGFAEHSGSSPKPASLTPASTSTRWSSRRSRPGGSTSSRVSATRRTRAPQDRSHRVGARADRTSDRAREPLARARIAGAGPPVEETRPAVMGAARRRVRSRDRHAHDRGRRRRIAPRSERRDRPTSGRDPGAHASLAGISCIGSTCVAVGTYEDRGRAGVPMIATAKSGSWSRARAVALPANHGRAYSVSRLADVDCPVVGDCVAVGSYEVASGNILPLVLTESAGSWGPGASVAPPSSVAHDGVSSLDAVSCVAPGSCTAVGSFTDLQGDPGLLAVASTNGTWGAATSVSLPSDAGTVPRAIGSVQLDGVSCTDALDCHAVGSYLDDAGGYVPLRATELTARGTSTRWRCRTARRRRGLPRSPR